MNKTHTPISYHSLGRPSLLSIAILGCLTSTSTVHSGETASCTNGACSNLVSGTILTTSLASPTTDTNSLSDNTVTLDYTSSSPAQPLINAVYGAKSSSAIVKNNKVLIKNGVVTGSIKGGESNLGDAIGNSVTISDVTLSQLGAIVSGGDSNHGDVTGNSVTINGGKMIEVYGGSSDRNDSNGVATDNSVTINGGTMDIVFGGEVYRGTAKGNKVTVNDGRILEGVHGARGGVLAENNSVTIIKGEIGGVTGGSGYKLVKDNSVNISGGSVSKGACGGIGVDDGSSSATPSVTGNSLTISGGTFSGFVCGGAIEEAGSATSNNVTIKGAPEFTAGTILSGGYGLDLTKAGDIFTGNTLNIHTKNISVANVQNFEHYNFYLGADVKNGDTLLTLTGASETNLSKTNAANQGRDTQVKMGVESTNGHLKKGHKVTLIKKTDTASTATLILPSSMSIGAPITAISGISTLFDFKVSADTTDKKLVAELTTNTNNGSTGGSTPSGSAGVTQGHTNPQTKALLESGVAMTDFVNRGTDLAENAGFSSLKDSQAANMVAFGATSAGKYRTDAGSHVDVSGAEFILGVGKGFDNSAGNFSIGGFAEFGTGSYNAHNNFTNAVNVDSSGNAKYYGLGVIAQQEFNNALSIKGGMSFGRTDSDFSTTDILNSTSNVTSFDSNRDYFSAFAGVGYDIEINTSSKVNVYADVKHTHLSNDEQTIADEKFNFDAINSTRSTLGARWSKDINADGSLYAGAAWEHEFDGTASGHTTKWALAEPSLKGNTGIFEAGYTFNPDNNNLKISIGAQGTVGKRRGASANANVQYDF